MTEDQPISPIHIECKIVQIIIDLETHTEAFEGLSKAHAKAEAAYKAAWYKEFIQAEGAMKAKESWAGFKTTDLHYEMLVSDALVRAKREKLHSLRTACDALRTLSANVRIQSQ